MDREDDSRRSNIINKDFIKGINVLAEVAGRDDLKDRLKNIVAESNVDEREEINKIIEKGKTRNRNQENVEELTKCATDLSGIDDIFSSGKE